MTRQENLAQLKRDISMSLRLSGANKMKNLWSQINTLQKSKEDVVSEAGKYF